MTAGAEPLDASNDAARRQQGRLTSVRSTGLRLAKRAAGTVPRVRRLVEDRRRLSGEVLDLRSVVLDREQHIRRLEAQVPVADHEVSTPAGPNELYPPGHFYSPLPDLEDIRRRERQVFERSTDLPGIDLRSEAQLQLAAQVCGFATDHVLADEPTPGLRYYLNNGFFGLSDARLLFCMLRYMRPAQVVEVGSGFSSALMLDTVEQFLDGHTSLTFIEPYPDRLHGLLRAGDDTRATVLERRVQDVDPAVFDRLSPGDVLFIDSSHVSKIGSDVNLLLLDVVPRLPAGVHIHVHDIMWPFEYAPDWVYEGRAWNEAYLLRALLVGNARLRVSLWLPYLLTSHPEQVRASLPTWVEESGTSIWLETV